MTVVLESASKDVRLASRDVRRPIRLGVLGLGQVGSAVVRHALAAPDRIGRQFIVSAALVRDPGRRRSVVDVNVTEDATVVLDSRPSVIVEMLGGTEPARTLVLAAIARGIPVVTANKSLIARHGDELLAAAADAGVPLHHEASVIAGVPFLGTFARRPWASSITSFVGIVNGTTNYILSGMRDAGRSYEESLAEAQRCGFAEPDPASDISGIDAAEKLTILIRQFGRRSVDVCTIETVGINAIERDDSIHAQALGGVFKPVVFARGLDGAEGQPLEAFVGPAFVPNEHSLARVNGSTNALCLRDVAGNELSFAGPGAGPDVTAATVLDDVMEAVEGVCRQPPPAAASASLSAPESAWFVRITHEHLPANAFITGLLESQGIAVARTHLRSTGDGCASLSLVTGPCSRARIETAGAALRERTGAATRTLRALEARA